MGMGRRRKENLHLPPRLHKKGSVYYYTPYVDGKLRWIRLSDNYGEALGAWAQHEGAHVTGDTVGAALDRYLIEILPTMAEITQREYRRYAGALRPVFGDVHLADMRPTHIAQYLDRHPKKVTANREIAMLSSVLAQAMRWGWVDKNPCKGIRRNTEVKRRRRATPEELAALMAHADPQMRCVIEMALATALRKGDLLRLRLADLTPEGLNVKTSKTGTWLLFEWTLELKDLVDRTRALRRHIGSLYLFASRTGQPYTPSGFDSIWQRLMKRAGVEGLHFHDLRAEALTRAKAAGGRDYAQALAGHKSGNTTEIYLRDRSAQRVRPVDFRKEGGF